MVLAVKAIPVPAPFSASLEQSGIVEVPGWGSPQNPAMGPVLSDTGATMAGALPELPKARELLLSALALLFPSFQPALSSAGCPCCGL